ncbi:MAG: hypothetical protein ACJ754_07065 [Pyrinomonadaceae bacterium]
MHNLKLKRVNSWVEGTVDLSLDFVNTGSRPVIILRPEIRDVPGVFWAGWVSLSWTREDSETEKFIYAHSRWPSFRGKAEELAGRLDEAAPPDELTRVIRPDETWTWRTQVRFDIPGRAEHTGWGVNLGWDAVGGGGRPVWLRVGVGMWPFGLEMVRGGPLSELQRRWQGVGLLWVGGEGIHHVMMSEPIILRLNETRLSSLGMGEHTNGLHPTAETLPLMYSESLRAAGDAGR